MQSFLIELEGYRARVEKHPDGMMHGRVIEINEPINFKASSLRLVESRFAKALEAYFDRCKLLGMRPEQPIRFD